MSGLILIFGEDDTDRRAIAFLVRAINAQQAHPVSPIKTLPFRNPIVLSKNAERSKRKLQAEQIAAILKIESKIYTKAIAVVHTDCDDFEPAHLALSSKLRSELLIAGAQLVVTATPAWEIEAWWMLFPEALASIRPCWKKLDYPLQQVGAIRDAKSRLTRALRPTSARARSRCPDYCERDSIKIAQEIEILGLMRTRQRGQANDSFNCFVAEVRQALA